MLQSPASQTEYEDKIKKKAGFLGLCRFPVAANWTTYTQRKRKKKTNGAGFRACASSFCCPVCAVVVFCLFNSVKEENKTIKRGEEVKKGVVRREEGKQSKKKKLASKEASKFKQRYIEVKEEEWEEKGAVALWTGVFVFLLLRAVLKRKTKKKKRKGFERKKKEKQCEQGTVITR
jgi:cytochrome c-type biogenesis protein CcmH/NrfF